MHTLHASTFYANIFLANAFNAKEVSAANWNSRATAPNGMPASPRQDLFTTTRPMLNRALTHCYHQESGFAGDT